MSAHEKQCDVALERLRLRPITTLQMRNELYIMASATVISTLKQRGHKIVTQRVDAGTRRKQAQYALLNEVQS